MPITKAWHKMHKSISAHNYKKQRSHNAAKRCKDNHNGQSEELKTTATKLATPSPPCTLPPFWTQTQFKLIASSALQKQKQFVSANKTMAAALVGNNFCEISLIWSSTDRVVCERERAHTRTRNCQFDYKNCVCGATTTCATHGTYLIVFCSSHQLQMQRQY